ncbi:unnamed protein product [Closterium sp. NIES-53]
MRRCSGSGVLVPFIRDTSADKLSARAIPCVFLGFVPDAPGWQFYHLTSRHVLPSQDVMFDESVPFNRLFPYRSAPPPLPPPFLAPGPPPVAVVSGAAPGTASGGAASWDAEPGGAGSEGAGSGGAEPEGIEPGVAESEGAESGGAEPRGVASSGGPAGASPRPSLQQLRDWLVQRAHCWSGAPGAGEPGDAGAGGAAVTTGAGDPTEPGAAGAGGAGAGVAGVGGSNAGGTGAAGAGAIDPGAGGARGTVRPRPYFVPLLQQVLGVPSSTGLPPLFLCPPLDQSQPPLQPASPLPVPSPYTEQSGGLIDCRAPTSHPVSRVRTARPAPRSRPPPLPRTHTMALRPSSVPQRVPLPAPPEVPDPESDRARAASPTVARLLSAAVTDPSFESTTASALVAELLDFATACRLDYASALVVESVPTNPPSVGGECALGSDVLDDWHEEFECLAAAVPRLPLMLLSPEGDPDAPDIPTPRSYAEAITGPYSSQWQAAMDDEMVSWKSTGTYVDEVPPPGVNIVDGMWIFRGVDYFQTFSPTPKMTTVRVLLHVAAQRDYDLHSLDFSTAFLQGSLHKEIWLCRPPGFTGSFPAGTQWSLRRPVYGLRQAPREWHDTLRTILAALGFAPSTADPSLFLRTDTSLPPFYVLVYVDNLVFATADTEALTLVKSELQKRHACTDLGELRSYLGLQITRDRARRTITLTQSHMVHQVLQHFGFQYSSPQLTPLSTSHSLSAPPSDESIEPSGPFPELVGCLMYLMTCTRPDLAYPLSLLACYVALGRHRKVHWDAAKRVLRYLCSTSGMGLVLGGRGPVVLTGHADASWVDDSATQRSSQGYTFSLGSGLVSSRSIRSSSVLISSCGAEIYAGAMAAQELRWLTYLLTDLGEQPRLPPVLSVDNKAMIVLCQEHRLEHRMKHIALRYFLARELQQRGQLRLAYVATPANTADVFTKALLPGDHQRFVTVLGLGPDDESVGEEERRRFHSLVGRLMYAAVNTQRDVAYATMQLARVVQCPNEDQVAAGMRVAKYLGQTPTVGLQYSAAVERREKGVDGVEPERLFLTAFLDASYASEPEDMTSVGGFICCVGGGPTAWESKKQVDQALSSVESEYMALFRAVWEIVWQRHLLAELGEEQQGPTPLYCDSQGAIDLAKNPVLHGLTKHMRVNWHWTRSMVTAGEVELRYVKTTGQPADMMTKRLVEQRHWKCCKLAGMALN